MKVNVEGLMPARFENFSSSSICKRNPVLVVVPEHCKAFKVNVEGLMPTRFENFSRSSICKRNLV